MKKLVTKEIVTAICMYVIILTFMLFLLISGKYKMENPHTNCCSCIEKEQKTFYNEPTILFSRYGEWLEFEIIESF